MVESLKKYIWEEDGVSRTYSPEAAAVHIQQGGDQIIVFITQSSTRDNVLEILGNAGLSVDVSEAWPTLSEKPGTRGLTVTKIPGYWIFNLPV